VPRFAANLTMLFQELPFLDRFDAAAACGFEAVEFLFPYAFEAGEIAERVSRHGLEVALFNLPPGDWDAGERGLAALPGREAEFAEAVETGLRYARALGCRRLHAMAGRPGEGAAAAEGARATYLANLGAAADRLAPHGVDLLLEPLNPRDMPGYHLRTTGQARAVIEELGRPNVRLQLDLYHLQVTEGDLVHRVRALMDITGHVQVANPPDRREPSEGEVNFPHLFGLLDELGYGGWVGCEYRPAGPTEASLGWAAPYGIGAPAR
jgi:hydroxypyruvate isomerase